MLQHPIDFPGEQAYEGNYVIQTTVDAVHLLSEVGRAFANLKAVIETRPIYHGSGHPSRNRSGTAGLDSDKTFCPCQTDQWFCAKLSNRGHQPEAQNGKAAYREAGGRRDAAVCPSREQNGTHAIL